MTFKLTEKDIAAIEAFVSEYGVKPAILDKDMRIAMSLRSLIGEAFPKRKNGRPPIFADLIERKIYRKEKNAAYMRSRWARLRELEAREAAR